METNQQATQNETAVWFEIFGRYNGRWEYLTAEDTRDDADDTRRTYEENEPGTVFKVVRRRGLAS